jgi:putative ABC transport system ATP-binding protein
MSVAELEALRVDDDALPISPELQGAWAVLRRGLRESPELRKGLWFTVVVSLGVTISSLVTPVLIQLVFDHGFDPEFRPDYVLTVCAVALGLVVLTFVAARAAARRLV